ncbi:MAG: hypothetical protein MK198_03775 [Gracilimonas sp.]|uniref:hypothetical protein n=1 Tax=Gracilimonas sp. TaxID=1974203 RepID=UPI003753447C|nr:hypothetical protein [Gracilimonas sp.]
MKYRVRLETTNEELHRLIWDEIRRICSEHSVPLVADRKNSANIDQINLKAEIRANKKLAKDNPDGDKPIEL